VPHDDALHDRQSDAGALVLARVMKPLKHAEELRCITHVETDSVVAHAVDVVVAGGARIDGDARHVARRGELDRVRKQVQHDLVHHPCVSRRRRNIADRDLDDAVAMRLARFRRGTLEQQLHVHERARDRLTRHAGEREEIFDERCHARGARAHDTEEADAFRIEHARVFVGEDSREAVDCSQRCAQVVRHGVRERFELAVRRGQILLRLRHARGHAVECAVDDCDLVLARERLVQRLDGAEAMGVLRHDAEPVIDRAEEHRRNRGGDEHIQHDGAADRHRQERVRTLRRRLPRSGQLLFLAHEIVHLRAEDVGPTRTVTRRRARERLRDASHRDESNVLHVRRDEVLQGRVQLVDAVSLPRIVGDGVAQLVHSRRRFVRGLRPRPREPFLLRDDETAHGRLAAEDEAIDVERVAENELRVKREAAIGQSTPADDDQQRREDELDGDGNRHQN
jgi:hypothetical protein